MNAKSSVRWTMNGLNKGSCRGGCSHYIGYSSNPTTLQPWATEKFVCVGVHVFFFLILPYLGKKGCTDMLYNQCSLFEPLAFTLCVSCGVHVYFSSLHFTSSEDRAFTPPLMDAWHADLWAWCSDLARMGCESVEVEKGVQLTVHHILGIITCSWMGRRASRSITTSSEENGFDIVRFTREVSSPWFLEYVYKKGPCVGCAIGICSVTPFELRRNGK
jgi:hypothetical protein